MVLLAGVGAVPASTTSPHSLPEVELFDILKFSFESDIDYEMEESYRLSSLKISLVNRKNRKIGLNTYDYELTCSQGQVRTCSILGLCRGL